MIKSKPVVFVVDDDPAMRKSLRWLIESVGLDVESYATAHEFLDAYDPDQAGCLVVDVRMPGMSGLDLQEKLNQLKIGIPIIIITGHADVSMAVRAMKSGAVDFIEKPFSDQALLDRIQSAIDLDTRNRERRARTKQVDDRITLLTPREREVMDLVVDGKSSKEIAAQLGLSPKTIEVHRAHLMEKMQADSLADLIRMAVSARTEIARLASVPASVYV